MNEPDDASRFRILVCVDGSDEAFLGLRYASRFSRGLNADVTLIYVRKNDQGLRSGGLQVDVARENITGWGLELPGIRHLKKARDILAEMGDVPTDWSDPDVHQEWSGQPLGDQVIEYRHPSGRRIRLRLKVASNVAAGILDQQEEGKHDLIILGAFGARRPMTRFLGMGPIAMKIAMHATCSVLVAREHEEGLGHLLCTDGSEKAMAMIRKDARMAHLCECSIHLLTVIQQEEERVHAEEILNQARTLLASLEVQPASSVIAVGDPVAEIVERGKDHSLTVVADSGRNALSRFLVGSVTLNVLEHSKSSVMIVR